jgi:hypothetical protein
MGLMLAATASRARAAEPAELSPHALIRSLARPAPAAVAFREVRFSALLDRPLIVAGELRYSGPSSLDRIVTEPYREETAIRGESVRIERDGERPRTFALKRAPELRGLLSAFSGLLAGDPEAVARNFEIAVTGATDGWRLTLAPSDARARQRLTELTMTGAGDEPRCFSMLTADGAHSVMLLGPEAKQPLEPTISAADLQARCASPAPR